MRSRIKLLSLTVGSTVVLLTIGAVLVVLGIFDEVLNWDIFSPEVERMLYAFFGSCVALGGFGAAISLVLGIKEVVHALRRMIETANPAAVEPVEGTPRRGYLVFFGTLAFLLIVTVAGFGLANQQVGDHRLAVFKVIVEDQMRRLGPHLSAEVGRITSPCETCASPELRELVAALNRSSFCQSAVLFLPDPRNELVLWRYPTDISYEEAPGFERIFVATDLDRAVKLALSGDTSWIDQMNRDPAFNWWQVIKDGKGAARGVLRIIGNPNESYREYQAVAQAAQNARK